MAGLVGEVLLSLGYLFSGICIMKASETRRGITSEGQNSSELFYLICTIYLSSRMSISCYTYWRYACCNECFLRDDSVLIARYDKTNDIFACPYSLLYKYSQIEVPELSIN